MSTTTSVRTTALADGAAPKKGRRIQRVVSAPVIGSGVDASGAEPKPTLKMRRIRRVNKDSASSAASPLSMTPAPIQSLPSIPETFVETMDDPLTVREVVRVTLRKFTHGRSTFWRDSLSEKL